MFGIGWSELVVIAVVALIVMDPKDIPALIRSVKQFFHKLHLLKQEMLSVINEIDEASGLSELQQDLTQEKVAVNQQLRKIVDLNGNLQDAYDLSDLRPDLKTTQADSSDLSKTTLH
jgi:sec-independent protein translocase protein TatB